MNLLTENYELQTGYIFEINNFVNDDFSIFHSLKVGDEMVYFNKKTIVSGCKLKHLVVGDKVIISNIKLIERDGRQLIYAGKIQIVDLVKKWDSIVGPDTTGNGTIIRPEVFNLEHKWQVTNVNDILAFIDKHKFKKSIFKKIMLLYCEGKPLREIETEIKNQYTHRHIKRIIDQHLEIMRGEND